MSRYYMQYDAFGEPRALVWPNGQPAATVYSDRTLASRFEREARQAIDADEIYDRARHAGLSDTEARALLRKELAHD